jgi:hypothetical protein
MRRTETSTLERDFERRVCHTVCQQHIYKKKRKRIHKTKKDEKERGVSKIGRIVNIVQIIISKGPKLGRVVISRNAQWDARPCQKERISSKFSPPQNA